MDNSCSVFERASSSCPFLFFYLIYELVVKIYKREKKKPPHWHGLNVILTSCVCQRWKSLPKRSIEWRISGFRKTEPVIKTKINNIITLRREEEKKKLDVEIGSSRGKDGGAWWLGDVSIVSMVGSSFNPLFFFAPLSFCVSLSVLTGNEDCQEKSNTLQNSAHVSFKCPALVVSRQTV